MEAKKSSSKQVVAILLLVIGLAAGVFGVLGLVGGGGTDPYEARKGIVMVRGTISDTQGNSQYGWGTGWAIGKPGEPVEYFVTNGHVVAEAYEYPKLYPGQIFGEVQVFYSEAENDYVQAQVVYYSPGTEKDIAIVKIPSPTDKRVALTLRDSDTVKMGMTAYALGFPGDSSNRQTFPTFGMDDVTITRGIISNQVVPSWATHEAFQMDVSIAGGNSGGPLVDERGRVIGINTSAAADPQTGLSLGMNYAIIIDELTKILDGERIEYTMAGGGLSWTQPWFAYVFLPIGVLALAGGIILLVTSQKNGQGAPVAAGAAAGMGSGKAPARGGRGPVEKRAVLRGVTGKYSGQSFDLLKGKVVIGRDPATCNIVFDKNTPGISGRHCQVVYDPNEDCFIITDLGSSYGTFLGNGKKLTANVAEKLSAGDTFYLCDNANRFVVSKE